MLFSIKNGPSTFQQYINNTLCKFFNVFVTAYINDILIYLSLLSKTSYIKKQEVLYPLPILIQRWRDILIDFVVDLPNSNRFINIIVVVNYFIKMRYIIPMDLIDIILVAECFIKYIFKLYRLPNLIVSDYRRQFVLDFQ